MFTQCPACDTIFKISAEVLRAAAGEVRCGRCGDIFNALRSLAEEPRAFTAGESAQELEVRADQILRTAVDPVAAVAPAEVDDIGFDGAPGTQIAQLEIQGAEEFGDWSDETAAPGASKSIADDPSMEFTLPPGELDRIFVEARPHHFVPGRHKLVLTPDIDELEPVSPEHLTEPAQDDRAEHRAASEAPSPAADHDSTEQAPQLLGDTGGGATALQPPRHDWIEQIIPTRDIEEFEPARAQRAARWVAAAILLASLLAVQVVHYNRDALAQSPGIGSALRSFYQIAGYPIALPVNLGAFEVRQWGVTGDASASGTLKVRASLINTGAAAQPYPLLRLTLADRFGTRVGQRDFLPREYLRGAVPRDTPLRPLDPGERADALVEIVDPGKTAEGFELDVCEQRAAGGVVCANETPALTK